MAPMPGRLNHLVWDVVAAPESSPQPASNLDQLITQQERSSSKSADSDVRGNLMRLRSSPNDHAVHRGGK